VRAVGDDGGASVDSVHCEGTLVVLHLEIEGVTVSAVRSDVVVVRIGVAVLVADASLRQHLAVQRPTRYSLDRPDRADVAAIGVLGGTGIAAQPWTIKTGDDVDLTSHVMIAARGQPLSKILSKPSMGRTCTAGHSQHLGVRVGCDHPR
jgi:hypothetical protein